MSDAPGARAPPTLKAVVLISKNNLSVAVYLPERLKVRSVSGEFRITCDDRIGDAVLDVEGDAADSALAGALKEQRGTSPSHLAERVGDVLNREEFMLFGPVLDELLQGVTMTPDIRKVLVGVGELLARSGADPAALAALQTHLAAAAASDSTS